MCNEVIEVHTNCPNCNKEVTVTGWKEDVDKKDFVESVAYFQCCQPYEEQDPMFLVY
jgi:Zn ribbon nucleic-acid-binding protein